MAIAPERMGIGIRRHFTSDGIDPYDTVMWEPRDARITHYATGAVAFEQLGVEVPSTWSVNATNILAQKYFRGTLGQPDREWSLRQVADRVADTITGWGREGGYFVDEEEARAFGDELKYLIVHQKAAFNSPVWFNIGVEGVPQQASACFILAVDDSMSSILNWYVEEGTIFKGGSGSGINLSRIRSSREGLNGGGTASGPVSFMRGADASAGTIKSGGKTRRAAKMVILDADHPDIEDFIWCKAIEERKARALRDAGFDMDLDGKDSHSIQYQNANNSVRVTDEFMHAVLSDADWHLRAVTTGEVLQTVKARDLFRQIAKATWECADPGMQFDTTINRWHTAPVTGRINASNPCCFTGDTLVVTDDGLLPIADLAARCDDGGVLPSVPTVDVIDGTVVLRPLIKAWVAGHTARLVTVRTAKGGRLSCTPEHRFLTAAGAWVEAQDLQPWTALHALGGEDEVISVELAERRGGDDETAVYDLEVAGTHNFAVAVDDDHAVVVHNSEYMHLDNSACNLASLNLMTFLEQDGSFDVEGFKATIEVFFTAQEILVGNADYPTEKIAETSRRFRQLGIGYANLGALLMAQGLPYDSDAGRAWAGAITALLTGHSYATSARTAARMGPFAGYTDNRDAMLDVLRMHRDEVAKIDEELVPTALLSAAQEAWDTAVEVGEQYGIRNSQASVLAPTGCLVGGSLIATARGLVRLHSLGDPDGEQWQDTDIDVGTDDGARRATKFYVNGAESVVEVETSRGHRIAGTPTHRVKVVDPSTGAWVWKRFAQIAPGDLVPLALHQLIGNPQQVALPPLPAASRTGEHHAYITRHMTPALAELVGYFMGDGSLLSRGLRFCVTAGDFDVVERLTQLGKEALGLTAHVTPKEGYAEVRFDSVRLALWWEACGFAKQPPSEDHPGKGYKAHIPDAVLHANERSVYAGFLRGLYEADGDTSTGYPTLKDTSLGMVRDVQSLLLAMGYPTTLSVRDRPKTWGTFGKAPLASLRLLNLSYNGPWLEDIGFMSSRKNGTVVVTGGQQAGRHDYIPLTRHLIDRLAPTNDRLRRVLLLELARGAISRRIATELYERSGDPELAKLLSFFYDTVSSARLAEDDLTYDLSVPDNLTYLANGFVSHNTIALLMDCDTTGIEPDLGLVKTKKLVGGGTMSIVNQTVPQALRGLGYDDHQISAIVAYIDEHKSIVGAPQLRREHLPVFACSMGDNTIHYRGHIRMMGAVQPFLSGAVSKTANLPEDATIEDVEQLYIEAWQLGIKAVAVYRDNCKVAQPLATTKRAADDPALSPPEAHDAELAVKVAELEKALQRQTVVVRHPIRERLARRRRSITFKFRVADCEGYVTVGEYDDGRPGEVFMQVSKQGSTLAGIMDAFAVAVSLGLQHGVPLATYVKKYTNMRFEPGGMTDDPELRIATSLVDYIFRRLAVDYLPYEERLELGVLTTGERMQPTLPGVEEGATPSSSIVEGMVADDMVDLRPAMPAGQGGAGASRVRQADAPYCYECGVQMQRAGTCFACPSCGTTSGCS
jgi:ribonucleoside-diphosphate reductase alpha chain